MSKRFDELFGEIVDILRHDWAGRERFSAGFDPRYYNTAVGQAWRDGKLDDLLFLRFQAHDIINGQIGDIHFSYELGKQKLHFSYELGKRRLHFSYKIDTQKLHFPFLMGNKSLPKPAAFLHHYSCNTF